MVNQQPSNKTRVNFNTQSASERDQNTYLLTHKILKEIECRFLRIYISFGSGDIFIPIEDGRTFGESDEGGMFWEKKS